MRIRAATTPFKLGAVLTFLLPGLATAQEGSVNIPTVDADPEVLITCLDSGKTPEACLGAMTVDCVAETDLANANLLERMCIVAERNTWIGLAVQAEEDLRERLPGVADDMILGNASEAFEAANSAWDELVEYQCRLRRIVADRHPERAIVQDLCARDLAAARYRHLTDTQKWVFSK